jgi:hypothetical protein
MLRYGTEMMVVEIPMLSSANGGFWRVVVEKNCLKVVTCFFEMIYLQYKCFQRPLKGHYELTLKMHSRKLPLILNDHAESRLWQGDPINQSQKREFTREISELLRNYIEANKEALVAKIYSKTSETTSTRKEIAN